jgi:hypothetical protein
VLLYLKTMESSDTELINPILPRLIDKMDPHFVELYTKYQGLHSDRYAILGLERTTKEKSLPAPRLRADQVSIEEYRANPAKYTFPIAEGPHPRVRHSIDYKIPVHEPPGEISVEVYTPTEEAVAKGGFQTSAGLPCHVDYHGGGWGKCPLT